MSYFTVTITRKDRYDTTTNEYCKIADTGGKDGGALYGYVDGKKTTQERTVEIYEQSTEQLDIVSVICAVNKIGSRT
jgi:hypothetical protein